MLFPFVPPASRAFAVIFLLVLPALAPALAQDQENSQKPRVLVLTDIENEPDDAQSLVRFLTYANQWDVEGLVATTSVHQKDKLATWRIKEIVTAYGKVRDNLLVHEKGFPETDYLFSVIKEGYKGFGMDAVGSGKDSEGSDWLISTVDKEDERPVWVLVWGGPNCLAQALWKVRMTRSPRELDKFVSKLRVYTISDQDDSGPWLRKTFPGLFYIASPGYHAKGGYHHATWTGISGDKFHGRFSGPDFSLVDNPWLDKHIRKQGPLGAEYPHTEFLMEGDSPSFLYLVDNGLGNSEHPNYGSWGGRYEYYTPREQPWFYEPETRPFWASAEDEAKGVDGNFQTSNKATIWRWRQAYQNDFAARIAWSVQPAYHKANHPPVARLSHPNELKAKSGEEVILSAEKSTDPDGNKLSYEWMQYREAGTYTFKDLIPIRGGQHARASFVAPKVTKPETIHFVVAVTDNGKPALTRYQRVMVVVYPE